MMLRVVLLFCVAVLGVRAQTTRVSQCTAYPGPLPINTYIEGCIDPPCTLEKGQYAVVHIIFRAPRTMRNMKTMASAFLPIIGEQTYPLGPSEHTCNFLANTYCPIVEGEVIRYTLNMFIELYFPRIMVPIEFRVVDENGGPVLCLRVQLRIIDPIAKLGSGNATLTDV
nr:uncharacterized protein LOC110380200 [Helicoverpa armigera]